VKSKDLGDADDDDLALHRELSGKERLDAILEARGLTTEQAVQSMNAIYAENQATFPHMIEATVVTSSEPGGPDDQEVKFYIGPFVDRRAAEAWASERYATNDRVSWQALKIITPEQDARETENIKRILDDE
jgi:hypothetical protein